MKKYILELIQSFRFADFFDIIVVSILVYAVMVWLKKTASRFVFAGIIILGLIYSSARLFHMYLTEYVLQGFFAILLIAMVIIFQEDLRRFFERLAIWGVRRKTVSSTSPYPDINVLTAVVANLARKRVGALIVIKGEDYLDRHLKGGVALNGDLSEAVLDSIFDPHSTGHDGSVVIENSHIVKFGCQLPLSLNIQKVGNRGLRHTAALGLSERSDALSIIVSEERGSISITRDGNLKNLKTVDHLKSELEKFYKERSPATVEKTWFYWLKVNPLEKIIAVFLACGLWLAFGYQSESISRDFVIPIVYRNLPSDWMLEEPKAKESTITLTGPEQAFTLLDAENLQIVLDMSTVQEGKQEIILGRDYVRHPTNLSVVGIEPSKIDLFAHKIVPTIASIEVQTVGTIPPGLTLQGIKADPATIEVMAIKNNKKRIVLSTEPVSLINITESTSIKSKIILPPDVRFINDKSLEVKIVIEVERDQSFFCK